MMDIMMKRRFVVAVLMTMFALGTYAWNGKENGRDASLPSNAELKDVYDKQELYMQLVREGRDGETSVYALWLKDVLTGEAKKLFETDNDVEPRWSEMKNGNAISVPANKIAAGELTSVYFLPWDGNKVFVEGCPDGRNIWTYVYDVKDDTAIQFPSTEGLVRMDLDKQEIHLSHYRYHPEGGRYSVARVYTADGMSTGEEYELGEE